MGANKTAMCPGGKQEKGASYLVVRLCIRPRAAGQCPHWRPGESWKFSGKPSAAGAQSNSLLSCSEFPQGSSAHINYLFTPCSTPTVLAELQYLLLDCSWVARVVKCSAVSLLQRCVCCSSLQPAHSVARQAWRELPSILQRELYCGSSSKPQK